jgi:hypothetical protein
VSDDAIVFGWCAVCEDYTGVGRWNMLDVVLLLRDMDLPMEPILLHDGRLMKVHPKEVCGNPPCCIHAPSDHPLNTAPLSWDGSTHTMWRVCSHLKRHPDPDDVMVSILNAMGIFASHPCDGCCVSSLQAVS